MSLIFEIEYSSSGSFAVVSGYQGSLSNYVKIPDYFNNYPVRAIGEHAFEDEKNLSYVQIPEHLVEIRDNAFSGCTNLKRISPIESAKQSGFPFYLKKIGNRAFFNTALDDLLFFLNDGTVELGEEAFAYCVLLKEVFFAGESLHLQSGVFAESALELFLGNPFVATIPQRCFMNCRNLRAVFLSYINIENDAFFGCNNLKDLPPQKTDGMDWL